MEFLMYPIWVCCGVGSGVHQESRTLSDGLGKGGQALQAGSFEVIPCCVVEQAPSLCVDLVLFLEQKGRTMQDVGGIN